MIFFKGARVYPTMIVEIKDVQTDVMQPMASRQDVTPTALIICFIVSLHLFLLKKNLFL